jgi:hypothetical protein
MGGLLPKKSKKNIFFRSIIICAPFESPYRVETISVAFKSFRVFLVEKYSKNSEKIVFFYFFYKIVKKLKNSIYTKNDDAEFEKEVFLHVGLDLTIKKLLLRI